MKTVQAILLSALLAMTLACGYSSKSSPPVAGVMPAIAPPLVPSNTNSGGGDFILTVNGSNFNPDAVVNWNGAAVVTTHVSGAQLTATIPAAKIASPATVPVTVTNPGHAGMGQYGGGGTQAETSAAVDFTVN
jgi:hypothetical protein